MYVPMSAVPMSAVPVCAVPMSTVPMCAVPMCAMPMESRRRHQIPRVRVRDGCEPHTLGIGN